MVGIASSKFQYFKRVRLDVPVIDFFFSGGNVNLEIIFIMCNAYINDI